MATLWEERLEFPDSSEVHWSTSTVMAVFMAASLVSAVFFGLGYSFGRGGNLKPVFTQAAAVKSAPPLAMPKSAPGPAVHPALLSASVPTPVVHPAAPNTSAPREVASLRPVTLASPIHPVQSVPQKQLQAAPSTHSDGEAAQSAAIASHYMVQVGAVGDRKDAQRLMSQLRQHGLHAGIYSSKRDKFLHVQIGPFSDLHQAQAMRHHVLASGYHAILKHNS